MPRKKKAPVKQPPTVETFRENEQAKRWLWIGVASFAVIIAGIWLWSFKMGISGFNWNTTPESQLIKNNYGQLDQAINNESAQMRQEYLKTQVKRIVNEIIAETNASSSTDSLKEGAASAEPASSSVNTTTATGTIINKTKN